MKFLLLVIIQLEVLTEETMVTIDKVQDLIEKLKNK